MRFHHSRGGQKATAGVRLGEEELLRSKLALRSISSLPLWPQHTHVHTVLHSCLCRAFTLTCCHFQTLTASFPTLIFTLTFNAEVKGSKIFPRPQNVNSFPKLSPLSGVCCASRELNAEQETFIQTQIEVSHPSPSCLLSTFYLIVSVSHIPPLCSSSESQD